MSLRQNRNDTSRAIAEGRFIRKVLQEEGQDINTNIQSKMNQFGFKSVFWSEREFSVTGSGNTLQYRHLKVHRFVDIKTRDTKKGKIKKKRYPIHNRIIYGHLNNVARELMFGFTEAVIDEMLNLKK